MTENMAGRGEGLAGLAEAIKLAISAGADLRYDEYGVMEMPIGHLATKWDIAQAELQRILAALEAAAPAGTPDEREHNLEIMLRYALEGRCAVCGWPVAKSANEGCVQGNCSMRPQDSPFRDTWLRRAKLAAALATPSPQAPERCPTCTSSVRNIKAGLAYGVLEPGKCPDVWHDAGKYERTHSRVWINAWNAAIEECAKHLREGWSVANKDNGDDVMEILMEELGGLMLPTPSIVGGPSSVPVGEQKQEEGV